MIKLIVLFVMVFVAALTGCRPADRQPVEPEFDRSGEIIRLKVIYHRNFEEIGRAKAAATGAPAPVGLVGWAGWNNHNTYCEVHVLRPRFVDDDRTLTFGHEVLHCVHGRYHPE